MIIPKDEKRYLPFSRHLKETFGERVYKIGIDAGFTCPNRDGTLGVDGCIYCYGHRSEQHLVGISDIKAQIDAGRAALMKRYGAHKFLAYFQSFTNTYAAPDVLESLYQVALEESGQGARLEPLVGPTGAGTNPSAGRNTSGAGGGLFPDSTLAGTRCNTRPQQYAGCSICRFSRNRRTGEIPTLHRSRITRISSSRAEHALFGRAVAAMYRRL